MTFKLGTIEDCLNSLLECLEKEDHPIIQILIKNITHILITTKEVDLSSYLEILFEKYYEVRFKLFTCNDIANQS